MNWNQFLRGIPSLITRKVRRFRKRDRTAFVSFQGEVVAVDSPWFEADKSDVVGLSWQPTKERYVAISKLCPE